jgi:tRNA A-37 threonylcarbamoyl transferase component Bud32
MSAEDEEREHLRAHREYFRDVIRTIHQIAAKEAGLRQVSVRPMGSGGARLSIPVKITGLDEDGGMVRLFGKILGTVDALTARSIQTAKNLYLDARARDPIFDFASSPREMAEHQYSTMKAVYQLGIPTAKPLGCYQLNEALWLLLYEFLEAKPVTEIGTMSVEQMDQVFGYLRSMHRHGIFHGDIKPENVMVGDKLYILDVGRYREDAPSSQKQAYDLACQIASFLPFQPASAIVKAAGRHYSREDIKSASEYLDLVKRRVDIKLDDDARRELLRLMS